MIHPSSNAPFPDCSAVQVEVRVEESWISRFVTEKELKVSLNEQYTLVNIGFTLAQKKLTMTGEILEKPGSFLEVTCVPGWNAACQQFRLEDLQVQTRSKNFLVKSAGWFAQAFMQNRIDARIEQATNQLYAHYLERLKAEPLVIPFPKGGHVRAGVLSVVIHEMAFLEKALEIKATVEGHWHLSLTTD